MKLDKERIIRIAVPVIGVLLILVIFLNAWKKLTTPTPAETGRHDVKKEAADDIWVKEEPLKENKKMTLSLKEAVLGHAQQEKNLIVFTQRISDIIKVTDKGALPFNLSKKQQYIKYTGVATYTVDLSDIREERLWVDEEAKTITIRIPHVVEKLDIDENETQADATENLGIFSIGDLKQSEDERAEVLAKVRENMAKTLADERVIEIADRLAKLSVWEIYQPVVTKVSHEYTVVVEFI
ncbi:MAG: DUF4230 domain-containing protein [Lachnospiraceae bacterium]|nr:DUF4230 domain-containing protein [Lachnospiraceae bacterium]